MDANELGKYIAALRKEKQITQAELAERLNVTDKAVSRWERGIGFPDINTLEPLADVLGVSLTELLNCKKTDKAEFPIHDVDGSITASIDIAKYQRTLQRNRILTGLILSILGIVLTVVFLYIYFKGTWGITIGGADGPTAYFIAGKLGTSQPIIGVIVGCCILGAGIITIIRTRNNDK